MTLSTSCCRAHLAPIWTLRCSCLPHGMRFRLMHIPAPAPFILPRGSAYHYHAARQARRLRLRCDDIPISHYVSLLSGAFLARLFCTPYAVFYLSILRCLLCVYLTGERTATPYLFIRAAPMHGRRDAYPASTAEVFCCSLDNVFTLQFTAAWLDCAEEDSGQRHGPAHDTLPTRGGATPFSLCCKRAYSNDAASYHLHAFTTAARLARCAPLPLPVPFIPHTPRGVQRCLYACALSTCCCRGGAGRVGRLIGRVVRRYRAPDAGITTYRRRRRTRYGYAVVRTTHIRTTVAFPAAPAVQPCLRAAACAFNALKRQ